MPAKRKVVESKSEENMLKNRNGAGLFIPAGLLVGVGIGFIVDKIPAGLFIGLGAGFLAFAIIKLMIK